MTLSREKMQGKLENMLVRSSFLGFGVEIEGCDVKVANSQHRYQGLSIATLLIFLIILLSGCSSTTPGNAAGITYSLPRTDGLVKLDVTLLDCDNNSASYESKVLLTSVVGAQDSRYYISGEQLGSSKIKRGFSIGVTEDGVINSISSSNTDRTSAIISNVLKSAGTILVFATAADAAAPPPLCRPEVIAAIARVKAITVAIESIKEKLSVGPLTHPTPANMKAYVGEMKGYIEQINVLATKLAAIKTGILRVETSGKIILDKNNFPTSSPKSVSLDEKPFDKWFFPQSKPKIRKEFDILWTATNPTSTPHIVEVEPTQNKQLRTNRECGFEIPIPSPKPVVIALSGNQFKNQVMPTVTLYAAQIIDPAKLCLDVGFGESRTVSLKFDKFGRTTDFSWNSEARGEAISGAIAGYASSLTGTASAVAGKSELVLQKEEIDRLTTQKTLNQLRKCEAIIEAGGFTCPSE